MLWQFLEFLMKWEFHEFWILWLSLRVLLFVYLLLLVEKKLFEIKLIKSALWSTLNKYRLTNLAKVSTEHAYAKISFYKIVDKFAEVKASKQKLGCYLLLQWAKQYGGTIFFLFLKKDNVFKMYHLLLFFYSIL